MGSSSHNQQQPSTYEPPRPVQPMGSSSTRDFGIGKRLTNLPALREIGYTANRRLLGVQQLGHDPITGTDALATITEAVTTATGARIPGLRFADQRTHALLSALLIFRCHLHGFTNKDLRTYTAELRGLDPSDAKISVRSVINWPG